MDALKQLEKEGFMGTRDLHLPEMVALLIDYYGYENIFGSAYGGGFYISKGV